MMKLDVEKQKKEQEAGGERRADSLTCRVLDEIACYAL